MSGYGVRIFFKYFRKALLILKDGKKIIDTHPKRFKIFNPFYSSKNVRRATELSLIVSQQFVQKHKAKNNFDSDNRNIFNFRNSISLRRL